MEDRCDLKTEKRKMTSKQIAKIGILGAVSGLLMLLEFPLFFAPSFYQIDFSEVSVLVGTFALGPVAGVLIEAIKILVKFIFKGTLTAGVGEFANFLIGACLIVPAGIIYKRKKNMANAIIGMLVGTLFMTLVGALVNYYVLIPAFSKALNTPIQVFIDMGTAINSKITTLWDLILLTNVPFNLVKGLVTSILVFLLYKRISPILHK